MSHAVEVNRYTRDFVIMALLTACIVAGAVVTSVVPAMAQSAASSPAGTTEPTPEQVKTLLQLLSDPVVKGWIAREMHAASAPQAQTPDLGVAEASVSGFVEWRLQVWQEHLRGLAEVLPGLSAEVGSAMARLWEELTGRGLARTGLLLAAFIGLGFGVEWLFSWATARFRSRIESVRPTTVGERIRLVLSRFLFELVRVLCFAGGSIGAFLLFTWPPQLRRLVLGYLFAFLMLRVTLALCHFLFAPAHAELRVVPMNDTAASLWQRWIAAFVGWFALGYVTIQLLLRLEMSLPAAEILAYTLGLALLLIALRIIWRPGSSPAGRAVGSVLAVLIWIAWVAGAQYVLWTLIVVASLPVALRVTHRAVTHLFRPVEYPEAQVEAAPASAWAVVVDWVARALLIVAAIWVLAWGWQLDLVELAARDTPVSRFFIGAGNAVIILLVADLLWQLTRTTIDRQLLALAPASPEHARELSEEEVRRSSRLRTLLPILRIMAFIVLAVMAVLMALSSLGVQIAPLIAGAGVVGLAIGFGAQTLVKDVISGMFFLLDDAFRVGEYIESGSIRGTVEQISIRSLRLRHHRGALHTIPFGSLDTITNYSRDWVIDKMTISVPYDTDLDKVKKIIKQIGKELHADQELAPHIIETLKMQGVEQFGDFAIQIRLKMMTKPGEQFVIRRRAYAMIKKAFAENGIEIALPTVQVAGGNEGSTAAAARQGLELIQQPAANT
jgi:small-conductance mechanosensitive channel